MSDGASLINLPMRKAETEDATQEMQTGIGMRQSIGLG